MDTEAQRDERGRKIATAVSTFDAIAGLGTMY